MGPPKVIKTMKFSTPNQQVQYLAQMGAQFRKRDERNLPLYKTAGGVVFRPTSQTTLEVLANCAC